MNTREVVAVGAGAAVLYGLARMFAPSRDVYEAKRFRDIWELNTPTAFLDAFNDGRITAQDIQRLQSSGAAERIGEAVDVLEDAPANWYAWDDDEKAVIRSMMLPNYAEQLLFTSTWAQSMGGTPAAFVLGFMSPEDEDDAAYLAAIVRHVERLRP